MAKPTTIAGQFKAMDGQRAAVLDRAREASVLTITSVLPREAQTQNESIPQAYQSLGAIGTESVTGKMLIALFPPGIRWYKFAPTTQARVTLTEEELVVFGDALNEREFRVQTRLESMSLRPVYRRLIQSILVAGNGLMQMMDDYTLRTHRLDHYVQSRDGGGKIHLLVVKEAVLPESLTEQQIAKTGKSLKDLEKEAGHSGKLDLYTRATRQREGGWLIEQEVLDKIVNESTEPVSPYFPAGYLEVDGEDYSRSWVEGRIGDLRSFNGLSFAMTVGMENAAKLNPVFDPAKGWNAKDLVKENGVPISGKVVAGEVDGIAFLTAKKDKDFRVALEGQDRVETRLGRSLLTLSSSVRKSERTTAVEVAGIQNELDGSGAGIYSVIATDVQPALLARLIFQMERDNDIATFDAALADGFEVTITGIDALGRDQELNKLLQALQVTAQIPGGQERVKPLEVIDRVWKLMQVDTRGLFKTDDEMAAEAQQAAAQQLQQAAAQQGIESAGAIAESGAQAAQQEQPAQ